jgi:hypothetical protein
LSLPPGPPTQGDGVLCPQPAGGRHSGNKELPCVPLAPPKGKTKSRRRSPHSLRKGKDKKNHGITITRSGESSDPGRQIRSCLSGRAPGGQDAADTPPPAPAPHLCLLGKMLSTATLESSTPIHAEVQTLVAACAACTPPPHPPPARLPQILC